MRSVVSTQYSLNSREAMVFPIHDFQHLLMSEQNNHFDFQTIAEILASNTLHKQCDKSLNI